MGQNIPHFGMSDQFTLKAATIVVGGIFCCELFCKVDLGVSSGCVTSALSPALVADDNGIFSITNYVSLLFRENVPQTLQSGGESMHFVCTLRLNCCP